MGRLGLAFKCFFAVLGGNPVPEEALPAPRPVPALPPPAPVKELTDAERFGAAVQVLSLLQQEGRLVDFLMEDLAAYDDEQIGAAVRNIHRDCRKVLDEHLALEPVIDQEEEATVTVEAGFDPSRVRLIGNVTGEPPFSGVLRHRGWRAARLNIAEIPAGRDATVVAPAEVDLP